MACQAVPQATDATCYVGVPVVLLGGRGGRVYAPCTVRVGIRPKKRASVISRGWS